MKSSEFRNELVKKMPGYSWTVHLSKRAGFLEATGTQSSGFNRTSTLLVQRVEHNDGTICYMAKSSGFGLRAPWLLSHAGGTLSTVLRGLQNRYESIAAKHLQHAADLQFGRKLPGCANSYQNAVSEEI